MKEGPEWEEPTPWYRTYEAETVIGVVSFGLFVAIGVAILHFDLSEILGEVLGLLGAASLVVAFVFSGRAATKEIDRLSGE